MAPSARGPRGNNAADWAAVPADDGFGLGYITYLYLDYKMKLMYRVAMFKLMHEQSCDDGEDAEGAHEPQGQVAFVPCFGPVSPCYCRPAGPLQPAPGCARFLFLSRSLQGNRRRQVVLGVLFFSCCLQGAAAGLLAGGHCRAASGGTS